MAVDMVTNANSSPTSVGSRRSSAARRNVTTSRGSWISGLRMHNCPAISLMLDGRNPHLELALKSADDEFHRSTQFLHRFRGVIEGLRDEEGRVDYRRLEETLGGKAKDVDYFVRELHLARAAIAIKRKALVGDAASLALADPSNPYTTATGGSSWTRKRISWSRPTPL